MRFTLTIELDNAAFQDNAAELPDMLRAIARQLDGERTDKPLSPRNVRDDNGNIVGTYAVVRTGRKLAKR